MPGIDSISRDEKGQWWKNIECIINQEQYLNEPVQLSPQLFLITRWNAEKYKFTGPNI